MYACGAGAVGRVAGENRLVVNPGGPPEMWASGGNARDRGRWARIMERLVEAIDADHARRLCNDQGRPIPGGGEGKEHFGATPGHINYGRGAAVSAEADPAECGGRRTERAKSGTDAQRASARVREGMVNWVAHAGGGSGIDGTKRAGVMRYREDANEGRRLRAPRRIVSPIAVCRVRGGGGNRVPTRKGVRGGGGDRVGGVSRSAGGELALVLQHHGLKQARQQIRRSL